MMGNAVLCVWGLTILVFFCVFFCLDSRKQDDGCKPGGDFRTEPAAERERNGCQSSHIRHGHGGQHGYHQRDASANPELQEAVYGTLCYSWIIIVQSSFNWVAWVM